MTSSTADLTHTVVAVGRRLAGLIALVCAFGLLSASSALAAPEFSFVGELTPSGGSFGSLGPNSVAISDVSGDRFVADSGAGVVYVFNAAGAQVAVWDGSPAANPPGVPGGAFGQGQEMSVAVNAQTGEVYVVAGRENVVDEFDENGKFLGQIAHNFFSVTAVAVDQATGEVLCSIPGAR